jgi:murein DD-endopeptidase MepM/ murein hydrolase activator NlpD
MNKMTIIFCLLALFACGNGNQQAASVAAQTLQQETVINSDSIAIKTLSAEFDSINTLVRDNKIEKAQALKELQRIIPALRSAYKHLKSDTTKQENWIFPVEGYSPKAIGGTRGEGYVLNGYNYFLGNKHGGHPAHDIFIYDKNQDSKDDRTGKYVNVLSVCSGIVVALENVWDSTSVLRGGKYIWIYAPAENALYYYAHNNEVLVNVGQMVNAGDTIAIVGRTGLNAFKKRSPTHLHFMKLALDKEFYPKPVDTYKNLMLIKKQ